MAKKYNKYKHTQIAEIDSGFVFTFDKRVGCFRKIVKCTRVFKTNELADIEINCFRSLPNYTDMRGNK